MTLAKPNSVIECKKGQKSAYPNRTATSPIRENRLWKTPPPLENPPLVILVPRRRRGKILEMGKVATLENRAEGAKFFEALENPP